MFANFIGKEDCHIKLLQNLTADSKGVVNENKVKVPIWQYECFSNLDLTDSFFFEHHEIYFSPSFMSSITRSSEYSPLMMSSFIAMRDLIAVLVSYSPFS